MRVDVLIGAPNGQRMISNRLDGKRVMLTQASDFMGPVLTEVFTRQGATMLTDDRALGDDPALPAAIVQAAGRVDVLLLHLSLPAPATAAAAAAADIGEAEWRHVFPVSGGWAAR